MQFINKLKAFFNIQNEPVELQLIAAEIKEGKAYLHPKQEDVTYLVYSDDISIFLNQGKTLTHEDIFKVEKKQRQAAKTEKSETKTEKRDSVAKEKLIPTTSYDFDRYKKKKLVISLYPEEYDVIISNVKQYGYKRADYLLACVHSASGKKIEKAHEKIILNHKELRKQQKQEKQH